MDTLGDGFFARYHALARAWARSVLGSAPEVDDVVQEAMLAVLRASEKGTLESAEHARNFLLRSVQGHARSVRRDKWRRATVVGDSVLQQLASDAAGNGAVAGAEAEEEGSRLLFRLLAELPASDRELLVRRYLRRETLASIASGTGVPISTLHSRERALILRLRRSWKRTRAKARGYPV